MIADATSRYPMQVSRGCVQVSFPSEVTDAMLREFRSELLRYVRDQSADSVVVDLSGLRVLDREEFRSLRATLDMTRLLGVHVVVTGLRPGVVAVITELDLHLPYPAGLDLDHGFDIVRTLRREEITS
ncbi:MAG: STAS domain-containing protein [Deltaproteobacteria bacterium]|nr:STAS domain-containing protein [Deltaproteobacteria bacterium]